MPCRHLCVCWRHQNSLNLTRQFLFIFPTYFQIFVANINHLGSISGKCFYAQKSINVIKTLHQAFECVAIVRCRNLLNGIFNFVSERIFLDLCVNEK